MLYTICITHETWENLFIFAMNDIRFLCKKHKKGACIASLWDLFQARHILHCGHICICKKIICLFLVSDVRNGNEILLTQKDVFLLARKSLQKPNHSFDKANLALHQPLKLHVLGFLDQLKNGLKIEYLTLCAKSHCSQKDLTAFATRTDRRSPMWEKSYTTIMIIIVISKK